MHQTQVHPQAIDLGLARIKNVLERLCWRQPTVPVITVAGTNGKGSICAYCTAVLGAAGYRVGTFTSPHLQDYRERIRVSDRLVAADELVEAFERIESALEAPPALSLTFFEYNAVASFLIFEAARLDAWVLEVGMGGRLDAVNVIDPTVAVVVSIGLDHQEFLGASLDAIAKEKAGIVRRGRAAILGSRTLPPSLLATVESMGARPKRLGIDFDYVREGTAWCYLGDRWKLPGLPWPALLGQTQFDNAATALATLEELDARLRVSPGAVAQGLASVLLPGRFQVIAPGAPMPGAPTPGAPMPGAPTPGAATPQWILDVAHNPDAARVLAQNLRDLPIAGRSFAVCGILADKDAAGIAAELRDCFDLWWVTSAEGSRGTPAAILASRIAEAITVPVSIANDIASACAAALTAAESTDRIVVFGSFHTVGPALDWLNGHGLLPISAHHEYTRAP